MQKVRKIKIGAIQLTIRSRHIGWASGLMSYFGAIGLAAYTGGWMAFIITNCIIFIIGGIINLCCWSDGDYNSFFTDIED